MNNNSFFFSFFPLSPEYSLHFSSQAVDATDGSCHDGIGRLVCCLTGQNQGPKKIKNKKLGSHLRLNCSQHRRCNCETVKRVEITPSDSALGIYQDPVILTCGHRG